MFAILILNTDKVREYAESLYEMEYTLDDTVAEGESSPRHLRTQSDDFKKEEMVRVKKAFSCRSQCFDQPSLIIVVIVVRILFYSSFLF